MAGPDWRKGIDKERWPSLHVLVSHFRWEMLRDCKKAMTMRSKEILKNYVEDIVTLIQWLDKGDDERDSSSRTFIPYCGPCIFLVCIVIFILLDIKLCYFICSRCNLLARIVHQQLKKFHFEVYYQIIALNFC